MLILYFDTVVQATEKLHKMFCSWIPGGCVGLSYGNFYSFCLVSMCIIETFFS